MLRDVKQKSSEARREKGGFQLSQAAYGVSERRACTAMAVDWSTTRYELKRSIDAKLGDQVKYSANRHRCYGYWRICAPI